MVVGCESSRHSFAIMKCPVPGSQDKIQIIKLEGGNLYTRQDGWKPHPGRYINGTWISQFATDQWVRRVIWDFEYRTYSIRYRPASDAGILSPAQVKMSGTYDCSEID